MKVILGVRPEEVMIRREARSGSVPGEVFVVEDLGNERLITLDLGGQFAVARVAADTRPRWGSVSGSGSIPSGRTFSTR